MQPGDCVFLEWDTSFWGYPIARVQADTLTGPQLGRIDEWCEEHAIRCLFFLARSDDAATPRLAESGGFRFVDIRVTLALDQSVRDCRHADGEGSIPLRESRREDIEALAILARGAYPDTRFFFDGNFASDRAAFFYETWIRRSCEGYADVVFIAEGVGGPTGYITCHRDDQGQHGHIGLVGISDRAQRRGVGRALVRQALRWFRAAGVVNVDVVTQGRNCAAQRLYQRCGFVSQSVQLWYHKWYPR